jgi:hypothetical protein
MRHFVPHKAALAHRGVKKHAAKSFADVGGCWGVHAGYTVHVLKKNEIDRAYVADGNVNDACRKAGASFPQLEFIQGQFNEPEFIESFPKVDALVMFSILLHQANLDWDAFLEKWALKARTMIIYNQMWKPDEKSVRFVDRGLDWYLENVFYGDRDKIIDWFGRLDETHPSGRKWRDMQYFWQFGVTTRDLIDKMASLGFRLDFFEDYGPWKNTPQFRNEGFIFVRNAEA